MLSDEVAEIRRKLLVKTPIIFPDAALLDSGSTLLNLACSGKWQGAFPQGMYIYFVGDTNSGKTFLTLTSFAEAMRSAIFKTYRIIYDNVERGAHMDIRRFFGGAVADNIEPPGVDADGNPVYSRLAEEFYFNLDDALQLAVKKDKPFIWVEDSMDGLTSRADQEKFKERKTAHRKGTKPKGDYGDGKAKQNSRDLRTMLGDLEKTKSILIIISQTRDNIDAGMFDPKTTRSGGRALSFYAGIEIWTSVARQIKREVRGKDRQVGAVVRASVRRSRLTGRMRTVEIPIFYDYGIDDIGGCVDYLVAEKHWNVKQGKGVTADEFDYQGNRRGLIEKIENEGLETELKVLVSEVWHQIERELSVPRKARY